MTDQEAITRVRAQFVASFNRGDISTLSDLITEDNVAMPPNRPMLHGKDECRAFWQEGFAAAESRFSVTPLETDIAGDIAVDLFRWTMDSAPRAGGEPVHDEGKNLWIWRRHKDSGWKLARAIWNSDLPQGGVWSGAATVSSDVSALTTEANKRYAIWLSDNGLPLGSPAMWKRSWRCALRTSSTCRPVTQRYEATPNYALG